MRTVLLITCALFVGLAAAPGAAAADPFPVCVTHPCGPDPVGIVLNAAERIYDEAEAAFCWVASQLDLQCQ